MSPCLGVQMFIAIESGRTEMVRDGITIKPGSVFLILINALIVFAAFSLMAAPARAELRATHFEISAAKERTTISLRLDQEPSLRWFQLSAPYRLVVDLPKTAFALERDALKGAGIVSGIRFGDAGEGRSRLILTMSQPFAVERLDVREADGARKLVVEVKKTSPSAFKEALEGQVGSTASISAQVDKPAQGKRFTIIVDAGHGGFDGGAKGKNGAIEKDVTLAFARELELKLKESPNYDVQMTRSDDRFLRLDERVEFARTRTADLFISIHADTIRFKGLRGATVYTGSDKASDAEAEALAERENLSDHIAGLPATEENPDVNDILHDFVRRETQGFSTNVAGYLVRHLSKSVGVINNPHRHARFKVLRAPDVPSVLIELGYLSNASDEKSLTDPAWRKKAAASIAAAVNEYSALRTDTALGPGN